METWKDIAEKKQKSLLSKIPTSWLLADAMRTVPTAPGDPYLDVTMDGFMAEAGVSPRELALTSETSIPKILKNYASREYSAEELVSAFCHRAAISHQMTESLAEIRFAEAISEAKMQDAYFSAHGKLVGPLHGIPISLKDQFRVEGLETAIGYIGWLGNVETPESQSLLVEQIRKLGGVIIAKTNVPQTLMIADSTSNLHRPCLNAYNRLLSPGGSSSGEGSLLASRGSVLGMGTDSGGSIRVPAAFNHLFGLKPSSGRFSYHQVPLTMEGNPVLPSVVGPMSTTLENLIHSCEVILGGIQDYGSRDPALVPLPWRTSILDQVRADAAGPGRLCFATFKHGEDGVTRPHPPVTRGVETACRAAREAGHRVIEWQPPSHLEAAMLFARLGFPSADDVDKALKLSGEPLVGPAKLIFDKGQHHQAKNWQEYVKMVKKLRKYQQDYAEYWESTKSLTGTGRPVDGLIMPVASTAAVRHNCFWSYNYTIVYNVLDYSAVTVPVTFANKSIDIADEYTAFRSPIDKANWQSYDAEIYHGAPVGVQVVGRRWEEEKVLALGEALFKALNTSRPKLS